MNNTSYTPGPWWVCGDMPGEEKLLNPVVRASIDGTTRTTICRTGQGNHYPFEWANARLISAAPELLEALRMVMNVLPAEPPAAGKLIGAERRHYDAIMAAKAAIRKAEGRA